MGTESELTRASSVRATATSYGRGVAGGLLIAMPLLLTMEMWWGGFTIPAARLLLLIAVTYGVLLVLQHYSGLHPKKTMAGQARAALVAYGIGALVSIAALAALGVVHAELSARDLVGKLVLEAVPVSIGASVAMTQFGAESEVAERRKEGENYWGAMAMAVAGAMLFGFSVAATEEPMMIGIQLTWVHAVVLALISLLQVHVIVYAVEFKDRASGPGGRRWWQLLLKEGGGAYVLSLLVAAYLLWTFGRLDAGTGLAASVHMILTLGFATSLGAAAGELLM
jgi:putative integral membrane protein (TIGR02587 family)